MEREARGLAGEDAGAVAQQRCARLRGRCLPVLRGRDTCALIAGQRTSVPNQKSRRWTARATSDTTGPGDPLVALAPEATAGPVPAATPRRTPLSRRLAPYAGFSPAVVLFGGFFL